MTMQGGRSMSPQSSPASNIEVRSLRLPKVSAPRAVAPMSLMQPQGGGTTTGFDPQFLNLLASAFRPVVPAQAPMLPPSQGASNTVSGPYAGPMSTQPAYRAPQGNPFAPAAPATPEYVGDVPQGQPQGLFDPNDVMGEIDRQFQNEQAAERYATRLGGGENFWNNVSTFMANQNPAPEPPRRNYNTPNFTVDNDLFGGGSLA